jgi:chromosome segregation ATPase
LKRSGSKKRLDDHSDSDSEYSKRSRGKPLKRSSSKKRLDDSDSETEHSSRVKPLKRSSSKKRLDDSDSETEYRKPKPTVEESVRQARTILKSVKKSKDSDVTVEVQQVMNSEMSALIAQLKTQREEMERRLKESETEATKLRLEREESRRQIVELETRKNDTEVRMAETKKEVKELQAKSTIETANQTSEKIIASAELNKVSQEREEMSKMIKKLEKAKSSMEGRLEKAAEETTVLKTEKEIATKRVSEVEKEREALRLRLSKIEQTKVDIESKLNEAEEEANQLKEEKKLKTREIRNMRSSQHNRSTIDLAEVERMNITRDLKRVSEEKQQMLDMMAQLDSSRHRLQGLVEEDEMSLGMGSAFAPQPGMIVSHYVPAVPVSLGNSIGDFNHGEPRSDEEYRPAGWLGNTISNRSFNNLCDAGSMEEGTRAKGRGGRTRDPSERSTRSIGLLDEKREKARMAEKRLRSKMEKSRSARSDHQGEVAGGW